MYCWEAAKRSQVAITELLPFRKSTGVIRRDALLASQKLCTNGSFEDCEVRMCVKQPNRLLQQLLAVENKTILQQPKPSTFWIRFNVTLIFSPHHIGMRPEIFALTGHLKSPKNKCLWGSVEHTTEALTCCRKKIFMLKQKSSNLSIIGLNLVRNFLSDCLSTLH